MVKQVIVVRKDLNMRKGKIAAQAAHASLGVFFDRMSIEDRHHDGSVSYRLYLERDMAAWKDGAFTKIVVGCNSETELMDLYTQAREADLPCKLIIDSGKTEFNGVPTPTCLAIGPADESEVNLITGELGLI
jgi:PTH2 family peptidyl-tRNA hydrolase